MAYEIPKNLKYEEKVFFNLSLWQTLWLAIFTVPALIIFLKTSLSINVKAGLGITLALLGIGFAFLDLKKHTQSALHFTTQPREIGYLDKRMAKFIDINRIENDLIVLNNGLRKAVIQVQPINFHILSTQQQNAIISTYKDFLNSLDYPIQIVMRTVNLSLDEYLQQLELSVRNRKNEKLLQQFNDFQEFVHNYIEQNAVKNRLFYIVIPAEEKKREAAESQLEIRAKLCQEKLKKCNLTTKRLNTEELTTMLSTYYEGFIENENQYTSFMTILEKNEEAKT